MISFNKLMEYGFSVIFIVYVLTCMFTSTEFEWDYGGAVMVMYTLWDLHNKKMEKLAELEDRIFTLQYSKNKETDSEGN